MFAKQRSTKNKKQVRACRFRYLQRGLSKQRLYSTRCINIFVEFFIRDLGVSRTAFSGIWTVALAISSVMTPTAGLVLDRYVVRTTVARIPKLQTHAHSRVVSWV